MAVTTGTPGTLQTTITSLEGISVFEDAAAAAVIEVRKASVTGQVVLKMALDASTTQTIFFPKAIPMEGGTYVKEVSGSVEIYIHHNS